MQSKIMRDVNVCRLRSLTLPLEIALQAIFTMR